jgi:predicted nucleic acid-binding protein
VIFDTDVLIWAQRGNKKALAVLEKDDERIISVQTYMELMQAAKDKSQHRRVRDYLSVFGFMVLPLTENIGHRAAIYIEQYTLASSLMAGDAIIAATAVENNLTLVSANRKHFRPIKELAFKAFRP